MSDTSVLIVGAGPTGLLLGCELARRGVRFRIVERARERAAESRALAVHSRSLEVLDDIGAVGAMLGAGLVWRAVNFYSREERIAHIRFEGVDGPYPFILSIPQRETERILEEHLLGLGVRVERGVELVALSRAADSARALLRAAAGAEESLEVPWVVGCDGAHSTVRHALGVAFDGAPYEEKFVLADAVVRGLPKGDESHAYLSEDGPCILLPLPGEGAFRFLAEDRADDDAPLTVAAFQALLDARGPGGIRLEAPSWMARFRIHHRLAARYRAGPVFLAGDAAHIHSPVGGQGMNTGMQDAYNLAWKLDLAVRGRARPALLDSYETERRPIAQQVVFGTDRATRAALLRQGLLLSARNRIAQLLTSFGAVERKLASTASQLELNYRGSPIVAEDRSLEAWVRFAGGPRPGERAPDAQVGGERLHAKMRGAAHVLLVFGGGAGLDAIADAARARLGADLRVLRFAADSEARRRYGASDGAIVLVRPDKYVAYRAEPADAGRLDAYLSTIFV